MATSFIQLLFSIQHKYNVFKSLKEPINPTEVTVKKMFLQIIFSDNCFANLVKFTGKQLRAFERCSTKVALLQEVVIK